MGLVDPVEPAQAMPAQAMPAPARPAQPTGQSVEVGPELARLREEHRRMQAILVALVVVIGILAVIVVVLAAR